MADMQKFPSPTESNYISFGVKLLIFTDFVTWELWCEDEQTEESVTFLSPNLGLQPII